MGFLLNARRRAQHRAVVAVTVFALISVSVLSPTPAHADDAGLPSWSEVNAAAADGTQAAQLVTRIEAALDALDDNAATLGDAAVAATLASTEANEALQASQETVDRLNAERERADADAETARAQLGNVVLMMSRNSGGADLTAQLVLSSDSSSLLDRLGYLERVSLSSDTTLTRAIESSRLSESLAAQATEATAVLKERADQAAVSARAADTADTAAQSAVADAQAKAAVLYAQLATLKKTDAETERQAREQQREQASYEQQQNESQQQGSQPAAPAPTPTPTTPTTPTTPPTTPVTPTDPGTSDPDSGVDNSPAAAKAYAQSRMSAYGWNDPAEYTCLVQLWTRESNWRYQATNPYSGAYGIPQSLPGSKMATAGADWRTNSQTQINWGMGYIASRYGTPCSAWAHSESTGWY